ncbi:MAG: hypothetical protein A4E53_01035 [Pelotomaculum sp. PtaB.Bin104]|nr:MAG: hypothetical protein A4E53_01035 [Pelotomaculum sp. PtaB.Bin104]
MSKIPNSDGTGERHGILVKVRLDIKGTGKSGRFLFGGKTVDKAAEESREQQLTVFRNVPIQGIQIIDIDCSTEIYTVNDELTNNEIAYAPMELTIKAYNLENVVRFITREDFRKIEVLDPASLTLNHNEIERLLFKIFEEIKEFRLWLERKYNLR